MKVSELSESALYMINVNLYRVLENTEKHKKNIFLVLRLITQMNNLYVELTMVHIHIATHTILYIDTHIFEQVWNEIISRWIVILISHFGRCLFLTNRNIFRYLGLYTLLMKDFQGHSTEYINTDVKTNVTKYILMT